MQTVKSAVAQAATPVALDQYTTPNFPLLGALVAVTCADANVRIAVWAEARSILPNVYGLSPKHTELLMLPEGNPVDQNGFCYPTPAEVDVVIEELGKVLKEAAPISGPINTQPPAFDPDFAKAYPTMIQVYLAMQFRIGQVPNDWQSRMRAEFNAFGVVW